MKITAENDRLPLSHHFRGRMVSELRKAYQQGQLERITHSGEVDSVLDRLMGGRGRNAGCPAPPAQIPACATNAPGSSLVYERQNGGKDEGAVSGSSERSKP